MPAGGHCSSLLHAARSSQPSKAQRSAVQDDARSSSGAHRKYFTPGTRGSSVASASCARCTLVLQQQRQEQRQGQEPPGDRGPCQMPSSTMRCRAGRAPQSLDHHAETSRTPSGTGTGTRQHPPAPTRTGTQLHPPAAAGSRQHPTAPTSTGTHQHPPSSTHLDSMRMDPVSMKVLRPLSRRAGGPWPTPRLTTTSSGWSGHSRRASCKAMTEGLLAVTAPS